MCFITFQGHNLCHTLYDSMSSSLVPKTRLNRKGEKHLLTSNFLLTLPRSAAAVRSARSPPHPECFFFVMDQFPQIFVCDTPCFTVKQIHPPTVVTVSTPPPLRHLLKTIFLHPQPHRIVEIHHVPSGFFEYSR